MNDSRFLKALKRRGKLKLVQPSEDICSSYLHKSDNCLAAARILLDAGLCENSIAEAYYGMYLCVMALFFRCGIKCESHTGAVPAEYHPASPLKPSISEGHQKDGITDILSEWLGKAPYPEEKDPLAP